VNNPDAIYTWEYPQGSWFPIIIDFDVDNTIWTMSINGTELAPQFFGEDAVLGAMNFFSFADNNEMFIDAISFEDVVLTINEVESNVFKAYPNPVTDLLYLSTQEVVDMVEVYDILGHNILSINPGIISPKIDLSSLSSGSYFLRANVGNQSKTLKIIK
jgi:hypothetical protein